MRLALRAQVFLSHVMSGEDVPVSARMRLYKEESARQAGVCVRTSVSAPSDREVTHLRAKSSELCVA